MDISTYRLILAVHQAPFKCVLVVTGGGAGAVAQLLGIPGGSRTIIEALVPYHEQAFVDFLGHIPESFCSAATSREMAQRAKERGCWLRPGESVIGLGCTASLATDRPKRGDHRFHVAIESASETRTYSLTLTKGARAREGEEAVLNSVMLNALAEAFGISERITPALFPGEQIQSEVRNPDDPLTQLIRGAIPALRADMDGRLSRALPQPMALVPGAFNPIHEAHWRLRAIAACRSSLPGAFELSVVNVDKAPLTGEEIRRRLHQFTWKSTVWLTRAPTFAEKAVHFPGAVFAVGADTAARIVALSYYRNDATCMADALDTIRRQGCRFLVAGRAEPSGQFVTVDELSIPAPCRDLFTGIPESEFRLDLSSTELRQSASELGAAPE